MTYKSFNQINKQEIRRFLNKGSEIAIEFESVVERGQTQKPPRTVESTILPSFFSLVEQNVSESE